MVAKQKEFLLIPFAFFTHSNRTREAIVRSHRELSEKRNQDIEEKVEFIPYIFIQITCIFIQISCIFIQISC